MPDLDRALRDLLTDDRLELPVRRDASRIVREGVRRRRRRRTIAATTVLATTTGVAVAVAFTVPALLTSGADRPSVPTQPHVKYDVAWVDQPAPRMWSPKAVQPKPPTMDAPRCLASQLKLVRVDTNGGGGVLFHILRLRNISSAPCLLVGTPPRVVARMSGKPDVVATRGLQLGSGGVGGDLQPGKLGYLTLETNRDCPDRYATPSTFPTNDYSSLSVTLPSGTSFTVPMELDAECGLKTGGLGINVAEPHPPVDPRTFLEPIVEAPRTATPGSSLDYVVTLTNPTDSAISLSHCPGYVETLGPSKEVLGLDCSGVHSIGAGASVRYEMRIDAPTEVATGPLQLTWTLLVSGDTPLRSTTVIID